MARQMMNVKPLIIGGLLADAGEEFRKKRREPFFRCGIDRVRISEDVCILAGFPEEFIGGPKPPVIITVTDPEGFTWYPHDVRTWAPKPQNTTPAKAIVRGPTRVTAKSSEELLAVIVSVDRKFARSFHKAQQRLQLGAIIGNPESKLHNAIKDLQLELEVAKGMVSVDGALPSWRVEYTKAWLNNALACREKLERLIHHEWKSINSRKLADWMVRILKELRKL